MFHACVLFNGINIDDENYYCQVLSNFLPCIYSCQLQVVIYSPNLQCNTSKLCLFTCHLMSNLQLHAHMNTKVVVGAIVVLLCGAHCNLLNVQV